MRPPTALIAAVLLLTVSLGVLIPIGLATAPGYPYFHDEGSTAHAAERIAGGEHLYRDLLYFKAPLSYYVLAWLFAVLPLELETIRLAGAFLLAVLVTSSTLLATWLSRVNGRIDATSWAVGALTWALALHVAAQRVTWHNSWCASLLSLLAIILYASTEACASRHRLRWIAVGAIVGAATLTKQTFGAAIALGIASHRALLFLHGRNVDTLRPLGPVAVGLIGAGGCWALFLLTQGVFASFVELVLFYPLRSSALASSLAVPLPPLGATKDAALFYVPPLFLLVLGARSTWPARYRDGNRERLAYAVTALALYVTLFPTANYAHLRPILPISLVATAPLAAGILRRLPERRLVLVGVIALAVVIGLGRPAARMARDTQVPLDVPRSGNVTADPATVRDLQRLVDEIGARVKSGEPIFVVPWGPMVYFFTGRVNPTRARIIAPGQWNDVIYQQELIRDLDSNQVELAVRVTRQPDPRLDRMWEYAPLLASYLDDHFELATRVGPYDLLTRSAKR